MDSDCVDTFRCVVGVCVTEGYGFGSFSCGAEHSCAVTADGSMWCWGNNDRRQLGLPATQVEETPQLVGKAVDAGQAQWRVVAVGREHTCAIRADTSLWCWGRGDHGALSGQISEDATPFQVLRGRQWRMVAAGAEHSCAIEHPETLWCWGQNANGQLGKQPQAGTQGPVQIEGSWHQVAASGWRTCAVSTLGRLWCWGTEALSGQSNASTYDEPTPVDNAADWAAVAVGPVHGCGIKQDASLWCWGDNDHGALGDGSVQDRDSPVRLPGEWLQVACGEDHTCAVALDRSLWCWGRDQMGQLGLDASGVVREPTRVGSDNDWYSVSAGDNHTCAWRSGGLLWCWGDNRQGQVGKGDGLGRDRPTLVTQGPSAWQQLAAGGYQTCAVATDNTLWCWGRSDANEGGWYAGAAQPTQVGSGNQWTTVAVGRPSDTASGHICALATDNSLWCWGDNTLGQLGVGWDSDAQPIEPVPRLALDTREMTASAISLGRGHSCALFDPGDTSMLSIPGCCGLNASGQLGRSTEQESSFKMLEYSSNCSDPGVGLNSRWQDITSGDDHSCGIDKNSRLWCWGDNSFGQTTEPDGDCKLAQVNTFTWASVSAGARHTCGILGESGGATGSLWCWGASESGQVGANEQYLEPQHMAAMGDKWQAVAAGDRHACAIDSSQALWCWGANDHGQLGLGPTAAAIESTPRIMDNDHHWRAVAAGRHHTCGLRADHSLWCWGSNAQGQIGIGGAWYAAPVQVLPF